MCMRVRALLWAKHALSKNHTAISKGYVIMSYLPLHRPAHAAPHFTPLWAATHSLVLLNDTNPRDSFEM